MTFNVQAIYQGGILRLNQPLALAEGAEVHLTVRTMDEDYDPLEAVIGIGESGRTDGADNHDKYIYRKSRK